VPAVSRPTGGGPLPAEVPPLHGGDGRRIEVDSDVWSRLFYRGRLMSDVADFDEAAVQTVERWVARPPGQPWVLFVPLLAPHCPFQVQEPWFSQHDRQVVPPPVPAGDEEREPAFMQCIRDYYGTERAGEEVWREVIATYYGMVSRLDHHVGRILDAIEQQGTLGSTVTCFFADHGEYLGDFGLIEKFPSAMHDCITRDPLIIAGPGVAAGQRFDGVVELIDAFPTLLDLAGVAASHQHFGRSLAAQCRDATSPHRRYAFTEGGFLMEEEALMERSGFPYDRKAALQHDHPELNGKVVAVRDEEWTYVWRLYEPPELYHRRSDPSERLNLAGEEKYADIEERLRSAILTWLVETADVVPSASSRFPKVDLPRPGAR
jgi:arylsulfatase A-like enzyme